MYLALALFRLGWVSRFLSKAVITGFLAGAAMDVTIGELPSSPGPPSMVTTRGTSSARGSARSATFD